MIMIPVSLTKTLEHKDVKQLILDQHLVRSQARQCGSKMIKILGIHFISEFSK